ncbi:MAG: hypothetical protein Q4G25_06520 [Paracoccus sp. (in: a-proteobacteria)]|nr:hypothetical protein [Paracoccus sp. (in: a-proteobacteria)]
MTDLPAINPDAWSIFAVMRPVSESIVGVTYDVGSSVADAPSSSLSLRTGLNAGGGRATIYVGSAEVRLGYQPSDSFIGRTVFLLFTFSTRDGLRIFENGQEVAAAPDDKRLLTQGYGANEWLMWRANRGLIGVSGMLSIDLGWPEHRAYRRQMAEFFATKYGIA